MDTQNPTHRQSDGDQKYFLIRGYSFDLYWGYNEDMKTRVMIILFGVFLAACVPLAAQTPQSYLTVFGGIHHHQVAGTVEEYVFGENDFPVIPAHNGYLLGFSYLGAIGKRIGLEIDARYIGPANVDLEDPSDGDTIGVKAGPHAPLTANFLFLPLPGKIRPYLVAGGGVDIFLGKGGTYTSRYGYEIEIPKPTSKERFDAEAHLGAGAFIAIGEKWGVRLDSRYLWIFDDGDMIGGISLAAGLYLSL